MEKARWRIRICLLVVVLAAILVGAVYYWQEVRMPGSSEGILITVTKGVWKDEG